MKTRRSGANEDVPKALMKTRRDATLMKELFALRA
jgi:hypothetical protein